MLSRISIYNVALIDHIDIDFGSGFNVLTGETGAGKSIIIDSLNLILGERADKNLVRTGTDKAYVEGIFSLNEKLIRKLQTLGIEAEDGMLIISREVYADGRSIARLNNQTVTLSALREVTSNLADIHGQHEHQALLNPDSHIRFLDAYQPDIRPFKEEVRKYYTQLKETEQKLNADWGTDEERARKIDMLEFQINEISSAKLIEHEDEELKKEKEQLTNIEKIATHLKSAYSMLASSNGTDVLDLLQMSSRELSHIEQYDDRYGKLREKLNSIYYDLEDASAELRQAADESEQDPERLEQVEDRLNLIRGLCRKYGRDIPDVQKFENDARHQLETLLNAAQIIERLKDQKQEITLSLIKACKALSDKRKQAAQTLETQIKKQLQDLGMKNAEFVVSFNERQNNRGEAQFTEDGTDLVEFLFSANIGEPVRPLSKIISGGEMSRFMLAVKNIIADIDMIETMVFDEIDTGISGKMALITAQKIASIAQCHQVICITHLAQIAAIADVHFYIEKNVIGQHTKTTVSALNEDERLAELARLTGGENTKAALEHAKEIYLNAQAARTELI